jgi:hypothetical protein
LKTKPGKMTKKGILFTAVTLLLLLSLFGIVNAFVQRSNLLQTTLVESAAAGKIRYVEDDIIGNIYGDLLGIQTTEITRGAQTVTVNLEGVTKLAAGIDYTTLFQDYETFIEGKYADDTNTEISLNNFTPSFNILPYQSHVVFNENNIIATNNVALLEKVTLLITVNESNYDQVEEETAGTTITFRVILKNNTGTTLYDQSHGTNPSAQNKIKFDFGGGKNVQARFGTFDTYGEGTVKVDATTYAEVSQFSLEFTKQPTATTIVALSNISLNLTTSTTIKNKQITLIEE